MKRFLFLAPFLIIGFYLITPANGYASTGPPPNLYLKCDASDPVEYHVWLPHFSSTSPTLNQALRDCDRFLPAKNEIQPLIFQPNVLKSIVLENSADSAEFVAEYWPETDCGILEVHGFEQVLVAQIIKPDYCVTELFFGCGNMNNFIVAPFQKINHDISAGKALPLLFLFVSLGTGLLAGRFWGNKPSNQSISRLFFKLIGGLIAGAVIFVVSVIYFPPIANWIFYPSIPEFYIRLVIITAVVLNFMLRLPQPSRSKTAQAGR